MNKGNIRNFVIISHIDHGKSTLADRFLEITKTVEIRKMQPQYLDRMALERERGITIKMQPVRMVYHPKSEIRSTKSETNFKIQDSKLEIANSEFILNLIDTPGHVDFSYEVSRSLAAVEGAILLVDATKGIQAQTISNLEMARNQELIIVPAINKIDAATPEQIEETKKELANVLKIDDKNVFLISAKTGGGVEDLLQAAIKIIPSPGVKISGSADKPITRALIFDSEYDFYKGVIAYIRVVDGEIKKGEKIYLIGSKASAEVIETGIFTPELSPRANLKEGEIGYIATGLKDIEKCRVGDTITNYKLKVASYSLLEPLRGYKEPQPMVFASFYPIDPADYDELKDAIGKLKLNDASLAFEGESIPFLGRGFRCGFLGMLHLEIVSERLKRDYNLDLVITSPSAIYKIIDKKNSSKFIYNVNNLPEENQIKEIQEPWIELEIIAPSKYLGSLMKLLELLRGEYKDTQYLGQDKLIIKFEAPLDEVVSGFYDKLKSVTSGYGSMNYKFLEYRAGDLVKLDFLLAGEPIAVFSKIVSKDKAYSEGKRLVTLLKEVIPSQQFAVAIQAAIGGKIIARETKKAMRKDVTAPLYGGDVTRKKKLLEKQKKGKKKLAQFGKVNLPSEVFLKILKER